MIIIVVVCDTLILNDPCMIDVGEIRIENFKTFLLFIPSLFKYDFLKSFFYYYYNY